LLEKCAGIVTFANIAFFFFQFKGIEVTKAFSKNTSNFKAGLSILYQTQILFVQINKLSQEFKATFNIAFHFHSLSQASSLYSVIISQKFQYFSFHSHFLTQA
jgi:hypothetical protein